MSYSDTRYTGQPAYGSDFSPAVQHASAHHGGNEDFFANALSFIQDRAQSLQAGGDDIDEEHAIRSHQALYGDAPADGEVQDDRGIGAGAAMQALKMFTSGQGQAQGGTDGGFDQNQLIGLAMAQAGKLWDQKASSGAALSGDKQSAINNAAEMAMKMYFKSNGGGIGGTGGPGGLLGLASKFLH